LLVGTELQIIDIGKILSKFVKFSLKKYAEIKINGIKVKILDSIAK
jgi:hypothetical protein